MNVLWANSTTLNFVILGTLWRDRTGSRADIGVNSATTWTSSWWDDFEKSQNCHCFWNVSSGPGLGQCVLVLVFITVGYC